MQQRMLILRLCMWSTNRMLSTNHQATEKGTTLAKSKGRWWEKELLRQPPLVNCSQMRSLRLRHTNANVLINGYYSKRRSCNWGTLSHWQFSCLMINNGVVHLPARDQQSPLSRVWDLFLACQVFRDAVMFIKVVKDDRHINTSLAFPLNCGVILHGVLLTLYNWLGFECNNRTNGHHTSCFYV